MDIIEDDIMSGEEILEYFSKHYNMSIEEVAEKLQEGIMCGAIRAYDENGNIINKTEFHNA